MAYPTFNDVARKGFVFQPNSKWLDDGAKRRIIAQDAALTTAANATVPGFLLQYVSPEVIDVLTSPQKATAVLSEKQVGNWTDDSMQFRLREVVGTTGPYADYGDGPMSDINNEWNRRQQYIFQTSIQYGDHEVDMAARQKVEMVVEKQRAAADVISKDANRFYLLGVEGKHIYGLLNEPNLPTAIAPLTVDGKTKWSDKIANGERGTLDIFNDIRELFAQLQTQTDGLIDETVEMKLLISPKKYADLNAVTIYNTSVRKMITDAFTNLKIVQVPELSAASGDKLMLMLPRLNGIDTADLGFGLKLKQGRLVPDMSSFKQKFAASTYGCIMKMPIAYAVMDGI